MRLALLPMLTPAIVASAITDFAISMDDFVISAFLSSGSTTDTVPVRIYSTGRTAPTPALNALATVTLVITLLVAGVAFLLWRLVQARRGRRGSTLQEFAQIDAETMRRLGLVGRSAFPLRTCEPCAFANRPWHVLRSPTGT